jgi:hypothetical protein
MTIQQIFSEGFRTGRTPNISENEAWEEFKKTMPEERLFTLDEMKKCWEDACNAILSDISYGFLHPANQAKTNSLRDAEIFQALGETIKNFPKPPFKSLGVTLKQ